MLRSETFTANDDLVDDFVDASRDELASCFVRLVERAWADGAVRPGAVPLTRRLVELLPDLDDDRQGRVAILFGLLLEAGGGTDATEVRHVVAEGFDSYLDQWTRSTPGQPRYLALLYLLAHFPDRRDPVLGAATGLDPDDASRLDRALQRLDPARPDVGRAFPYPEAWELDEDERAFDRDWIGRLTPAEAQLHWTNDTETVLGHLGAKAYWAVLNGAPVPFVPAPASARAGGTPPAPADAPLFAPHLDALRCPHCHGQLTQRATSLSCAGCGRSYPAPGGILDLTGTGTDVDRSDDFLFKLAEMPTMGYFYETYARPNFLRLCGANWDARVTPEIEDAHISEHVRPVEGPVLDLAAGAGRWTSVLAQAVGAERVIALDLGLPMLAALRERLPAVPAVLTGADMLPFGDATLGAVLCWNALQAFPAQAPAAIAEVGRCLRRGGTFTLLTFGNSDDPVYRYFVGRHHFPQHAAGLHLFDHADVRRWIAAAGMRIRDEWTPGSFIIMTAERVG